MVFSKGQALEIVTIDSPQAEVLKTKTENIREDELELAKDIGDRLYFALAPFFPAAGLAAPQIGISKSVFIFSYNRDPHNLEVVINPTCEPIGDEKVEGWESCFSAILKTGVWECAKISRSEKIRVSYLTIGGEKVKKILEGFAAKVFQHEYDHLQGYVNVCRQGAEVKRFDSKEEFLAFLQEIKKQDAARYIKP
ncbi:MAG TPA: peptide deformylase [Rhabdochlamydiaceae bacterium]|jgi:peptide deformylase|nr:peptide deformylase [Rhabdochlamydiaceae bacterium]